MQGTTKRLGLIAVPAIATVAAGMGLSGPAFASASPQVFNVANYGAVGNGSTDNTAAFRAAIAAAEAAGGGEVYVPSGTYAFTQALGDGTETGYSVPLHGSAPIQLVGAGSSTTSLVEHAQQGLVSLTADGSVISGLTLDTATYDGGAVVTVNANDTTVEDDVIHGGDHWFALWYTGGSGTTGSAPIYNTGNQVLNDTLTDRVTDDGFSFSFQKDAVISNIVHNGSRLALYKDDGVSVSDYSYSPGPQGSDTNGFWITAPAQNITITDFTSSGAGGVIGNPSNPALVSNVKIIGERLTTPGAYHTEIGNVDGLTIQGASYSPGNSLFFNSSSSAQDILVEQSNLAGVRFGGVDSASDSATFSDDTFGQMTKNGVPAATFSCLTAPRVQALLSGDTLSNPGGLTSRTMSGSSSDLNCSR